MGETHQLINIGKLNQLYYVKSFKNATEMFFKCDICYTGADTPNITLTTFEEYHRRQFIITEYYCF
jgi:hypothetical protein